MIYKTRGEYSVFVPVGLSPGSAKISNQPGIQDVVYVDSGEFKTPTPLHQGYLLDNQGVALDTAFTDMTYAEYAALSELPQPENLFKRIVDTDPITELYECKQFNGYLSQQEAAIKFNAMIDDGKLAELCKRWK